MLFPRELLFLLCLELALNFHFIFIANGLKVQIWYLSKYFHKGTKHKISFK